MKKDFTYYLFSPCGNDTALIEGTDIDEKTKEILNNEIMKIHPNVEQVGFISLSEYKLIMAGGEFCGNATRSAAYYYLNGKKGEIDITVSNNMIIKAGVNENGEAWSEIPLDDKKDLFRYIDNGIYEIRMKGIKYIILEKEISKEYLVNKENIKQNAMYILKKYGIKEDAEAIGVIFLEEVNKRIKIHPIIWVKSINTLFYETACGGATTVVAILESIKDKQSKNIDVLQPSNKNINANVVFKNGEIEKAYISGEIETDNNVRIINLI